MKFSICTTSGRRPDVDGITEQKIPRPHYWKTDEIVETTVYFIELNSLEDLLKLRDDVVDEIIITKWYIDESIPEIEIYDSYRE